MKRVDGLKRCILFCFALLLLNGSISFAKNNGLVLTEEECAQVVRNTKHCAAIKLRCNLKDGEFLSKDTVECKVSCNIPKSFTTEKASHIALTEKSALQESDLFTIEVIHGVQDALGSILATATYHDYEQAKRDCYACEQQNALELYQDQKTTTMWADMFGALAAVACRLSKVAHKEYDAETIFNWYQLHHQA